MPRFLAILIALLLFCGAAHAADGFDAVKCGADIPHQLIGKTSPNEAVEGLQALHKDIGLEDLGADELDGNLNIIFWRICGAEYAVLDDGPMRDVIPSPPHSATAPQLDGECRLGGQPIPETVFAILDNPKGLRKTNGPQDEKTFLPAQFAWKIDQKQKKFVKLDTQGVTCALSGIFDRP